MSAFLTVNMMPYSVAARDHANADELGTSNA